MHQNSVYWSLATHLNSEPISGACQTAHTAATQKVAATTLIRRCSIGCRNPRHAGSSPSATKRRAMRKRSSRSIQGIGAGWMETPSSAAIAAATASAAIGMRGSRATEPALRAPARSLSVSQRPERETGAGRGGGSAAWGALFLRIRRLEFDAAGPRGVARSSCIVTSPIA